MHNSITRTMIKDPSRIMNKAQKTPKRIFLIVISPAVEKNISE